MEASLRKVVEEVPYCNFAGLYRAKGLSFPDSLGDNCLGQARRYRKLLTESGRQTRITKPFGGIHYALFVLDGGEWFFTDPSQNQCEPAPIAPALRGEVVRAQTYPLLPKTDSHLELTASTEVPNGLVVRTILDDGGSERVKLEAHYCPKIMVIPPAPDDIRMAALPQAQFLLRVTDRDEEIKLSRAIDERLYTIRTLSRRSEIVTHRHGYNSRFQTLLEKVAERVSLRPAELLSYFDEAATLYEPVRRLASSVSFSRSAG